MDILEDVEHCFPLDPAVEATSKSGDLLGIHKDVRAVAGPMYMVHQVLGMFFLMINE